MFKRIFWSAVFAVASIACAQAQTLPVKAPVPINSTPCAVATATTPLSCSGWYVGAGLGGEGSNADIIGSGIAGSVFAGGMVPTFDAGYQYAVGNWFFAAEFDVAYATGSGVSAGSASGNMNGLRFSEVFKVGGNLSGLLGTQAPITIPPQLAAAVIAPYAHAEPTQWQLSNGFVNGFASGAGVMFDIGPKWFGDLRYTYTNFNGARAGGISINNDQELLVTFSYKLN